MHILFANNAQSSLAADLPIGMTTARLQAGGAALFPHPIVVGQQYYVGTLIDAGTGTIIEIVHVIDVNVGTDTLTLVRGQEGTSQQNWAANDLFAELWTAGQCQGLLQVGDDQGGGSTFGVDTGIVANKYVCVLDPPLVTNVIGMQIRLQIKAGHANTGASTFNPGSGEAPIRRRDNTDLIGNELVDGDIPTLKWTGTVWRLSYTAPATDAAVTAGADKESAVTPKQLASASLKGNGQCYLSYVGTTQIRLNPFNGNLVAAQGGTVQIPAGGISISNTGVPVNGVAGSNLAPNSGYLVAIQNSGALDYWPVANGHSPDTTTGNLGVEVITPHPSRSLVGMLWTDAGGNFIPGQVLSWFNRQLRPQRTTFGSAVGSPAPYLAASGSTWGELDTSIRNTFLVWAGQNIAWSVNGQVQAPEANESISTGIGFDSPTVCEPVGNVAGFGGSGSTLFMPCSFSGVKTGLAEGQHYATLQAAFGTYITGNILPSAVPPAAQVGPSSSITINMVG